MKSRIDPIMAILIILGWGIASLLYRVLVVGHLEQTAMLFIGLPTFLAIFVALIPRGRSYTSTIMQIITIFLLMSGPLLGEGFICILMASPLFFAVGALVGVIADHRAKQRERSHFQKLFSMAPLLLLCLEGVDPRLSFSRFELVEGHAIVSLRADQVQDRMSRIPKFHESQPLFLKMGFPQPAYADGDGLQLGAARRIHFAGGEGKPGDLVWKVTDAFDSRVVFECVSDSSHIAHWLAWQSAEVEWRGLAPGQTEVTWKIRYRRLLDPAWYFAPWERYAVRLAGEYYTASLR